MRPRGLTLADALLTLAEARVLAGALGAGGTAEAQRIQRPIDSPQPAGRGRRLAASALALIAAPAVAFSAPTLAAAADRQFAVEHVEALVLAVMDMQRRSGVDAGLKNAERPAGGVL